jgi:hypothetical protein
MGGEMKDRERAGIDLGLSDHDKETLRHIAKTVIENKESRCRSSRLTPPY